MRRFKALAGVVSAVVLTAMFTQGFPVADAADENATPKAEPVHVRVYNVSNLPVYSHDGKTFDPDVLIAYIQAAVDAKAWDKGSSIAPYPANRSLVISTTSKNHEAISKKLEMFRDNHKKHQDWADASSSGQGRRRRPTTLALHSPAVQPASRKSPRSSATRWTTAERIERSQNRQRNGVL